MTETITKHFVHFLSPGTMCSEETTKDVESWDTDLAMKMADSITERYGATPYGFYFTTRTRGLNDFDSKRSDISCTYYLGGDVRTYEQVCEQAKEDENILRLNMKCNGWKRVITNNNSYTWNDVLGDEDVVLDYTPPKKGKSE
jgi:hypothetical protein